MLNFDQTTKIVFIIFFFIGINHADSLKNLTRYRRQAEQECFKCRVSGECIAEDKECDGTVDCRDGSDESDCSKIRCPPFAFRCTYGACIQRSLVCDGKSDCRDGSDETTPDCRTTTSSKCLDEQFQCGSDQCIPEDNKCDGVAQCTDASDETLATCGDMKCRGFAYKCAYGACVIGNAECNGYKDCYDNSDEDPKKCRKEPVTVTPPTKKPPTPTPPTPQPPVTGDTCVLPDHPTRGRWKLFGPQQLVPGQRVALGSILTVECNKQYAYRGSSPIYCLKHNTWSDTIGTCEILCPPLSNTTSTKVLCTKTYTLGDCAYPDEGTQAEFSCEPFYENRESTSTLRICHEGSWDKPKPECDPICGLKTGRAETLIVGGNNATLGDYPWHVGLYTNTQNPPKYACGGSLVSQNIVITAAHCVTNLKTGVVFSKDIFSIAVGKYYSKYDDPRDSDAQYSRLKAIYLMPLWRGEALLYQADIAILITKDVLKLTRRVQTICVDFDGRVMASILKNPEPVGTVVGWGSIREIGESAVVLKELRLPYIQRETCLEKLPEDFQPYLNYDKFCSGYLNQGESVCSGDSGGGLTFRNPSNGRYYLAGIANISKTTIKKITPLCLPIRNTESTTVICTKDNFPIDCVHPFHGTQARFSCETFYEIRKSTPPILQCQEGNWDRPKPSCQPICGLKPGQAVPLLAGGISGNTTAGTNPWHVSLYSNRTNPPQFLCSGTLISQNVILTAAHCVTNPKTAALLAKDQFTIAVGEEYREFNHPVNINAQHSKLEEIYLMPQWRGEIQLYQADIAVLITKDTLKLTQNVLPICMDYNGDVIASVLTNPKPLGRIVDSVVKSGLLKEFKVPYIPQCLEKLPEDFQQFLTFDKFCAGFLNKDEDVAIQNSGAGLMFQNPKDGRFYLAGILSLAPTIEAGSYALYTNVTQYKDIIIEKTMRHNPY